MGITLTRPVAMTVESQEGLKPLGEELFRQRDGHMRVESQEGLKLLHFLAKKLHRVLRAVESQEGLRGICPRCGLHVVWDLKRV